MTLGELWTAGNARLRGGSGRGRAPVAAFRNCAWALIAAVLWIGCGKSGTETKQTLPTVTVSRPAVQPVAETIEMTGSVAPSRTVDLMARVPGYLESVDFEDGTFVEKGRLLFVIEQGPYEEQLRLARAALLQAQSEYDRQLELIRENATSSASVERWLSMRDQATAQVELAKINLGYTQVRAPFSGRIGQRLVDPGNMVGTGGGTKLATLEQLLPIYVNFSMSERDVLSIRADMRRRGLKPEPGSRSVPVFIGLLNEEGTPHEGRLDFMDSGVGASTGTIPMRAVFDNKEKILFPGAFARVRIVLGEPGPMPVVPERAVGNDQEGDYVLVVGQGDVVERRAVVKGPLVGNLCAIREGLSPEDRVIVSGILQVRPGDKVTAVDREADAGGQSTVPSN